VPCAAPLMAPLTGFGCCAAAGMAKNASAAAVEMNEAAIFI
jgi:hypothetical protein